MKKILIKLIKMYQKVPGNFHNSCRHIPTCSNYGIEAITKHGSFKGTFLTIKRILKCNPWGSFGIDLVPERKNKMKKTKFLIATICLLACISSQTGCIKRDSLEDIQIYTTVYPIEYITDTLYGSHSTVSSIYPDGVNPEEYTLTNNQIKDYSKANMYIFNGLTDEKDYVTSMFKYNKDLMIIDAFQSMEYEYSKEELWLDPSNFLMIALNIKTGLLEYISNQYLKSEIEDNYDTLKIAISNIDANLKLMSETVDNTTIVVDNNAMKYLEKYGFTILSLEEDENLTDKVKADVYNLIKSNQIDYIFTTDEDNLNDTVNNLVTKTGVQILELNTISNITEDERSSNEDYIKLLNKNIDLIKNELYN